MWSTHRQHAVDDRTAQQPKRAQSDLPRRAEDDAIEVRLGRTGDAAKERMLFVHKLADDDVVIGRGKELRNVAGIVLQVVVHGDDYDAPRLAKAAQRRRMLAEIPRELDGPHVRPLACDPLER